VRRKRGFLRQPASPRRAAAGAGPHGPPLLHHAVITGGSSGIGLAIARELAARGCRHITLVARNAGQLAAARTEVAAAAAAHSTVVRVASVDVTDAAAVEAAAARICQDAEGSEAAPGPPTLLFHCAGYAASRAFADLSAAEFRAQADVNYLGSVHVVRAFLPHMARPGQGGGNIILTSSLAGQVGTFGYAAYAPTKFALRGFAECLAMELAATAPSVNISLAYPPDTQTPGYDLENVTKPEECRLISESAGVWDPEV
jgi:3-dehydrosphinganine reductase